MTSEFADRLFALLENADGLQARLHYLRDVLSSPGARPHSLSTPDYEKIRKMLEKKFPEGELKKEKGVEKFSKNAETIRMELRSANDTLVNAMKFKQTAFSLLNQSSIILRTIPHYAHISQTVAGVLRLLTKYVQVQIQLAEIKEKNLVIALYHNASRAFFEASVHSQEEQALEAQVYQELSSYFMSMSEGALKMIQEELMDDMNFASTIRSALVCIAPAFTSACNAAMLEASSVFELNSDSVPADLRKYIQFLNMEEAQNWVCLGFLCSPMTLLDSEEHEDTLLHLFKQALSRTFVIPLYRNLTLMVHDEFSNLLSWFPTKAQQAKLAKGSTIATKVKKLIADCAMESITTSPAQHEEARDLIASCMEHIIPALQENLALLGPKAPVVFALLAFSRVEIISFFRHFPGQLAVPKIHSTLGNMRGSAGKYDASKFKDASIGRLLHLHLRLAEMLAQSAGFVKDYSEEFLFDVDAPSLDIVLDQLQDFVDQKEFSQKRNLEEMRTTLEELSDKLEQRNLDQLASIIACARKAEILLLANGNIFEGSGLASSEYLLLSNATLDCIASVTQHAFSTFDFNGFFAKSASLGDLLFLDTAVDEVLHEMLDTGRGIEFALAFVKILQDSTLLLHRLNPNESSHLCNLAFQSSSARMRSIVRRLDGLMTITYDLRNAILAQPTKPSAAGKGLRRRNTKSIMSASEKSFQVSARLKRQGESTGSGFSSGNKFKLKHCFPGEESALSNMKSIAKLKQSQDALIGLVKALLNGHHPVLIWDRKLCPQEYIRNLLSNWLFAQIGIALADRKFAAVGIIRRPSDVLRDIGVSLEVVTIVSRKAELSPVHVIKTALFRHAGGSNEEKLDDMDSCPALALGAAASAHREAYLNMQTAGKKIPPKQVPPAPSHSQGVVFMHEVPNSPSRPPGEDGPKGPYLADTVGGWAINFIENMMSTGVDGAGFVQRIGNSHPSASSALAHASSNAIETGRKKEEDKNTILQGDFEPSASKNPSQAGINDQSSTSPYLDGIQVKPISGRTTSSPKWVLPTSGLGIPGIVFSKHVRGFVAVKELASKLRNARRLPLLHSEILDAQLWTSSGELRQLTSLLGLRGVRVVERHLLAAVSTNVIRVTESLKENKEGIEAFKRLFFDGKAEESFQAALQLANRLADVPAALVTCGLALALRSLLRENLALLVEAEDPICADRLREGGYERQPVNPKSLGAKSSRKIVADAHSRVLVEDSGFSMAVSKGETDSALSLILASAVASKDQSIWKLLPAATSMTMCGDAWKTSDLLGSVDTHANNVHVIPSAMRAILSSFFPGNTRPLMAEHLFFSSGVVARMKASSSTTFREWPLQGLQVFIEEILNSSEGILTCQDLEKASSHAIIHAARLHRSFGRVFGADMRLDPERLASTNNKTQVV